MATSLQLRFGAEGPQRQGLTPPALEACSPQQMTGGLTPYGNS